MIKTDESLIVQDMLSTITDHIGYDPDFSEFVI